MRCISMIEIHVWGCTNVARRPAVVACLPLSRMRRTLVWFRHSDCWSRRPTWRPKPLSALIHQPFRGQALTSVRPSLIHLIHSRFPISILRPPPGLPPYASNSCYPTLTPSLSLSIAPSLLCITLNYWHGGRAGGSIAVIKGRGDGELWMRVHWIMEEWEGERDGGRRGVRRTDD